MINSSETIEYDKPWFDGKKYIELQKEKILERISKFNGKLYLEIGWKFMFDAHASRVLPWFIPESKKIIFYDLKDKIDILFCVNAQDILNNRQITSEDLDYSEHTKRFLLDFEKNIQVKPKLVINKIDQNANWKDKNNLTEIENFKKMFKKLWYEVYKRYKIKWYPEDIDMILSKNWFWFDDYIKTENNLVLVAWIASGSGKMSTCMWQIYLDHIKWVDSWYAKYETFPIWNIELNHPINLAYEAATADIWDFNEYDLLYEEKTWKKSVNYNRDVEAFSIIKSIWDKFLNKDNYMRTYDSPTEMGISNAGFCIIDDKICSVASLDEVRRRIVWYQEMLNRWEWKTEWVNRCNGIEKEILEYIK